MKLDAGRLVVKNKALHRGKMTVKLPKVHRAMSQVSRTMSNERREMEEISEVVQWRPSFTHIVSLFVSLPPSLPLSLPLSLLSPSLPLSSSLPLSRLGLQCVALPLAALPYREDIIHLYLCGTVQRSNATLRNRPYSFPPSLPPSLPGRRCPSQGSLSSSSQETSPRATQSSAGG